MAKKRDPLSPEDLIEISKRGVKRFVRYDEGRVLYSMGRNRFIELANVECQVKLNTFSQISRIELNTLFYP